MSEDILRQLYPIGQERWIKVKFIDYEWCVKHLHWYKKTNELGIEVTAIGVRDEYIPQISALLDVRDEITKILYGQIENYLLDSIREKIKERCDELKKQTIRTGE